MADLGLTARATGRFPERPITFKWLHRMLRDPYYAGYIVYKGQIYPGRHEPIIDQALFDRVQEVLEFRSKNGQRDRVLQHYLKGTLFRDRCERNERTSRLSYTEARGRSGRRYGYFLCRGRQDGICDLPYLPADGVEPAIIDHYASLALADILSGTGSSKTSLVGHALTATALVPRSARHEPHRFVFHHRRSQSRQRERTGCHASRHPRRPRSLGGPSPLCR